MSQPLFEAKTLIQSLRKSKLTCFAAYGEVLDNSVQAEADKIFLQFEEKKGNSKKIRIGTAGFIDNGIGMDVDVLVRCLASGASTRHFDVGGIGKFGMGLPTASIKQCTDIKVYSKTKDSKWHSVSLILTGDPETQKDIIDEPIEDTPPDKYLKKVKANKKLSTKDGESGTIVVWKEIDQNDIPFERLISETDVYIGRTFRKFIWNQVEFYLNDELVRAIDPLYYNTECTRFSDDERSILYDPITFNWPVDEYDDVGAEITIQLSLLPEWLRPTKGSGGNQNVKERYIDQNSGISIMRNDREVYYGVPGKKWPRPLGSTDWGELRSNPIHRWWGCEISFDARLDDSFDVEYNKYGSLPVSELATAINDKIKAVVKRYVQEVQRVWKEADDAKKLVIDDPKNPTRTRHSASEDIANRNIPTKKNLMAQILDTAKHLNELKKKLPNMSKSEEAALRVKFETEKYSIKDIADPSNYFMDIEHKKNGGAFIIYNISHPFHVVLLDIYKRLSESEDSALRDDALRLVKLIDLLLISYTRAEQDFNAQDMVKTELLLTNLKSTWAQFASSLVDEIDSVDIDKDSSSKSR